MSLAYTPGLKRKEAFIFHKARILPIKGQILVKKGDFVTPNQIVAKTEIAGNYNSISASTQLGCDPTEISRYMIKKTGDPIAKGEVIALKKGWLFFSDKKCISEFEGTLDYVSAATGRVMIREPPFPIEITAYIPGKIVEILPDNGVVVECISAYLQGIFGIGGETSGRLTMIVDSPDDHITSEHISHHHSGKVIAGGSLITLEALRKAVDTDIKGIIVGGIENEDLKSFLGYEIGVAITGREKVGLTLILTEGFGKMNMAQKTFELLKKHEGKHCYITGETQIRAGVKRPEIIIPLTDTEGLTLQSEKIENLMSGMTSGVPVRIIGDKHFGSLGHVSNLPIKLQQLESESLARVVEVELEGGQHIITARANVEIIEE